MLNSLTKAEADLGLKLEHKTEQVQTENDSLLNGL